MATTTTLVCLFHHEDQAQAAVMDLRKSGLAEDAILTVGGDGAGVDALDKSDLASLGMPDRDYDHLKNGIRGGGIVVAVSTTDAQAGAAESVFARHSAAKIDEAEKPSAQPMAAMPAAALDASGGDEVIPIVEEDLVVGKRTVDAGGVRLYRRIVEVPVEESVILREEHVNVSRVPVDRAISDADAAFQPQVIELTETAEEAVVGKEARVVEEILVNKGSVARTETVTGTVRRTEVNVEEILPEDGVSLAASQRLM